MSSATQPEENASAEPAGARAAPFKLRLRNVLHRTWVRAVLLSLAFLLLNLLFVSRPIQLKDAPAPPAPVEGLLLELAKTEHQKAIDEIKLRMEQEDTWFHYKFIFVGGMVAFFLGYLGFF